MLSVQGDCSCSLPSEIVSCSLPREIVSCYLPREIDSCLLPRDIDSCLLPREIVSCLLPSVVEPEPPFLAGAGAVKKGAAPAPALQLKLQL